MAEVRVFGDVSEFLLMPLWRALEDNDLTIAHIIAIYRKMIEFLEAAAANPTSILEGQSPFDEIYVRRTVWTQKLLDADEKLDDLTYSIMRVTMATLLVYSKRQFADFLPGGKYADLTPEACRGVPKTNKKAESYFAYWD